MSFLFDSFTQMGCYGLGVTRILQAGIEVLSDDTRIQWPRLLAPYQICIIPQKVYSTEYAGLHIVQVVL